MENKATLKSYAIMVKECRDAQQTYFKTRQAEDLQKSKAKEKELDRVTYYILNPAAPVQTKLFNK